MSKRQAAMAKACPKCGAQAGLACIGKDGPRLSVHASRFSQTTRKAKKERQAKAASFYQSEEWRRVRYDALKLHGAKCQCCGSSGTRKAPLHVDHIVPRSWRPDLSLVIDNLQVLCADCNLGKGARDRTDWRRS